MTKRCILLLLSLTLLGAHVWAQTSPFIHVDQFGYRTSAMKVAVLSDPQEGYNLTQSYTPSSVLDIRDATTNVLVMSLIPEVWQSGQVHDQSGDRGWWLDFSGLTVPGRYYISDPQNGERSPDFNVGDNPYRDLLKTAGRMFFYNRCGAAKVAPFAAAGWTDGPSFGQDSQSRFISDPLNSSLWKDMSGGWFDAGDYNKYVTFAHGPVHDLLWAWQEHPEAFGDDWNIPESGNGVPDVLDEVKWELDWLWKMSNPDGSVHIKMGSRNYSENVSAPPSVNVDPRYYGPVCTSASLAVAGMFAHAAWVFSGVPGYEAEVINWSDRAEACFQYALPQLLNNNLDTDCDNGSIVSGDADWDAQVQLEVAIAASVYLFQQTAESEYHDFFLNYYPDTEPIESGFWGPYNMSLTDALLHYLSMAEADDIAKGVIFNSLQDEAVNNWNGYFGFNSSDLYRAYMPDWSYHWGSNLPKANYGLLNLQLNRYGMASVDSVTFGMKAEENLHYFHGVNPQGIVYLSNMYGLGATRSANEIYHTWFNDGTPWDNALSSAFGPAPGYVVGGPNAAFTVPGLVPPYGQPAQKSYLDFNTGWPDNSWEITEPAIYYQTAYLRLLAGFAKAENPSAINYYSKNKVDIKVVPNPVKDNMQLSGIHEADYPVSIYTIYGQKVYHFPVGQEVLNVGSLPAGIYIIVAGDQMSRFIKE